MAFRVHCPNCNTPTVILYSNEITKDMDGIFAKDLYCQCRNPECLATSVVRVSHSHYVQPPRRHVLDMAKQLLKQEQQQNLPLGEPL